MPPRRNRQLLSRLRAALGALLPPPRTDALQEETSKPSEGREQRVEQRLEKLDGRISGSTTIVASWAVALAAFGFFGFAQTSVRLSEETGTIKQLRADATMLQQQLDRDVCRVYREREGLGIVLPAVHTRLCRSATPESDRAAALDVCGALSSAPEGPVAIESTRLKRQAEERGPSRVSDDGSLVMAKTAGESSGRVEAARKGARAASEAADRATGVRLEIRALCTSIEQKKLRLKALKDEREKTVASVVEIPLKTPLFDTKVVTSLAPIAQLSLLCAAVFYVERKRREMLRLYVEAVELATEKIEEGDQPDMTPPMSPEVFNEKFDKHVGPIPLWLTPFPISHALSGAFETKNALGQSTSGPRAKLLALLVVTLVLALAYYLFASAVDTSLPSLLHDDASRRPTMRIDLSFIVASVLLVFTVAWGIMVLLPWTPPGSSEPQSKRRRMLAVVGPFATLLAVPVLAAATGRGAAVRTARSWTLLPVPLRVKAKCLLDQVMVTKPRKNDLAPDRRSPCLLYTSDAADE